MIANYDDDDDDLGSNGWEKGGCEYSNKSIKKKDRIEGENGREVDGKEGGVV